MKLIITTIGLMLIFMLIVVISTIFIGDAFAEEQEHLLNQLQQLIDDEHLVEQGTRDRKTIVNEMVSRLTLGAAFHDAADSVKKNDFNKARIILCSQAATVSTEIIIGEIPSAYAACAMLTKLNGGTDVEIKEILLERQQKTNVGLAYYKELLEKNQKLGIAWYNLAIIYDSLDDENNKHAAWQKYIDIDGQRLQGMVDAIQGPIDRLRNLLRPHLERQTDGAVRVK